MSTSQAGSRFQSASPESGEEVGNMTPLFGPLPVAETTDSSVVSTDDVASIDRSESTGELYFCLRAAGSLENRVEAPVRGPAGGPWASSGIVQVGGRDYQLQVSLMFATSRPKQRLYGILVPVTVLERVAGGKDDAEEPIVVWGSEDEGEGPDVLPKTP